MNHNRLFLLEQELANIFCKGPQSNYFSLWGLAQLCRCSMESAMQYVNNRVFTNWTSKAGSYPWIWPTSHSTHTPALDCKTGIQRLRRTYNRGSSQGQDVSIRQQSTNKPRHICAVLLQPLCPSGSRCHLGNAPVHVPYAKGIGIFPG